MIPERFIDSMQSLHPNNISNYLRYSGWKEESIDNDISLWHRTESNLQNLELLQPLTKRFRDYSQRVYEIILNLERFENRNFEDILFELNAFHSDVVKIRIAHEDVDNGSIPLDDGVKLFEKARELFISVVRSTFSKKKYFSGGKLSEEIINYLESIRLGQTERGSYIINLIAPIPPHDIQEDIERVSLTRSVTNTLANSLTAIEKSVEEFKSTNNISVFDAAISKGVSANLCDALLGLSGSKKNRQVDITISLSRSENVRDEISLIHVFDPSYIPYLEKASEYYKDNYILPNTTVTGLVTKLNHEPDSDVGSVTIDAMVNDHQKNVSMELPINEYWEAHRAHKRKQPIEITGDLHVSPKSAKILSGKDFRAFGTDDLFSE